MSAGRSTRARNNGSVSIYEMAEKNASKLSHVPGKLSAKKAKDFFGAHVLIQVNPDVQKGKYCSRTHMVGEVIGYDSKKKQLQVQPYNNSGDKDGVAMAEKGMHLSVLPR